MKTGITATPSLQQYRPEIDGIRAIAVLAVIFCHAGFEIFSGGFIGVDIFFVISGFLITNIIYGELQNKTFSIAYFYERRVRRIIPALFLVIIICIPIFWLIMMPDELKDFSKNIVAINLFASNILFWKENNGYFAAPSELKPMLHTWSLSVEEQFYLLFPLFFILFYKLSQQATIRLLAILTILSLCLSEWASQIPAYNYKSANFYLLPTRAWELGIGAILSVGMYENSKSEYSSDTFKEILIAQFASITGLLMVVYAIFAFDRMTPLPSVLGLIPTLGTALIIIYGHRKTIVGRFLSWKPVVGIGLISYSAYLWHQPLFAFARLIGHSTLITYFIGLTLVLGYLSWRFVEQPFRKKQLFIRRSRLFLGTTILSIGLIILGLAGHFTNGFPNRLSPETQKNFVWGGNIPPRGECSASVNYYISPEISCIYGDNLLDRFAILGDSHASALSYKLAHSLNEYGYNLRELTYSGCPPIVGSHHPNPNSKCPKYNREVRKFLSLHKEITTIILLSRWTLHMEGKRFNNQEGCIEPGRFTLSLEKINENQPLYRKAIQHFLQTGKQVILVYPVPEVGWDVPRYLARESHFGRKRTEPLSTSDEVFKKRNANAYKILDSLGEHPNLIRVFPEKIFCNTFVPNRCVAQLNDTPLYYDDDHLNSIGAGMLSEEIIKVMKSKGWL